MFRPIAFILCLLTFLSSQAQVLPSFGNSRTGGTGMQFLKIPVDARSTSMAGAVAGIANDPSAMFWNPSGITGIEDGKLQVQLAHSRYFANVTGNFFGAVFKNKHHSFFGVQAMSLNYPDMEETTEWQPYGTGRTVNLSNFLLGFTYARVLTDNFSFGVNTKWAREGIGEVLVNNVLFDLGLSYNIGIKHSRFGVSFSNFGMNVSPTGEVSVLKLGGVQSVRNFSEVAAPSLFRIGGALDPVHTKDHVLTLAMQLNHPTDNNETYAAGAEYSYKRLIYLRTGYELGSDEYYTLPTAGMGVRLNRSFGTFRFDYGFSNKTRLGNLHRIAFSVCIL